MRFYSIISDGDFIPDLTLQSAAFAGASAGLLGDNPLVTLWFGGNDLLAAARDDDLAARDQAARDAADAIVTGAMALSALGVDNFLIPNTGDIGATPQVPLFEADAGRAPGATAMTELFNDELARGVGVLRGAGLRVIDIDTFARGREVAANPMAFGPVEAVIPRLFPSPEEAQDEGQPQLCSDATERSFFDGVHPNNVVQQLIEADARTALAAVPLPATLPLVALGGVAALRARRPV